MTPMEEIDRRVERTLRANKAAVEASRRLIEQREAQLRESRIKVDLAVQRLRRAGILK